MLKTSWDCVPQNLHEKNYFYNSYILLNFPYLMHIHSTYLPILLEFLGTEQNSPDILSYFFQNKQFTNVQS